MNFKNIFKSPWLWILLISAVVIGVLAFSGNADGYKEVKTATMVGYFDDAKIKKATFTEGEQQIKATLTDGKTKVKATWLGDQSNTLVTQSQKLVDEGKMDSYNVEVPKQNTLLSMLFSLLPFVIFIA